MKIVHFKDYVVATVEEVPYITTGKTYKVFFLSGVNIVVFDDRGAKFSMPLDFFKPSKLGRYL